MIYSCDVLTSRHKPCTRGKSMFAWLIEKLFKRFSQWDAARFRKQHGERVNKRQEENRHWGS